MRLLIVDDDAAFRALLRTTFEVVDVDVEEAGTAEAALESVRLQPPEAIVLDVGLPGMGGVEFCRLLEGQRETAGIAVVLLSGSVDDAAATSGSGPTLPAEALQPARAPGRGRAAHGRARRGPAAGARRRPVADEQPAPLRAISVTCSRSSAANASSSRTRTGRRSQPWRARSSPRTRERGPTPQRVQRYALELARPLSPELVDDPSAEYGFLLHDVGKIGILTASCRSPGL